jgi:hypothetical protein
LPHCIYGFFIKTHAYAPDDPDVLRISVLVYDEVHLYYS